MSPSMPHKSPMGRHTSKNSISPARGHASPRKRSPVRRERSPDSSPRRRSPTRREKSPRRRSPYHRDRSPARHRNSHRSNSPRREKNATRDKPMKHERSRSPISRSPSPRTKRLRRAQAERDAERMSDRGRERDHEKGSEKTKPRERERDELRGREKRSERDGGDGGSARSRHERSVSPSNHHRRSRHRSNSSPPDSRARDEDAGSRGADQRNDDNDSVARMKAAQEALESKKKQEPSFEYSGKLAEETNRVRGITLLFSEPPDARKPTVRWRLYVFKAGEVLNEPLYVHRNSCYLFGRERRIADIPTDHPSCSKQHAVLQYRQVEREQPDGTIKKEVRPYIMDLGSTNKTFINDNPIEPQRYYELLEKDTIKFGNSSREYVLLHENSAT